MIDWFGWMTREASKVNWKDLTVETFECAVVVVVANCVLYIIHRWPD